MNPVTTVAPPVGWLPRAHSVLVVLARPGQESADLGGLLYAFRRAGTGLALLCLTRGEASPVNSTRAGRRPLSVRDLANVFAAFRWGGLLRTHDISAMEFPYSVAGLTAQHLKMRWPDIGDPRAPDKPGTRFRLPFGAVPVVLSLGYRATA